MAEDKDEVESPDLHFEPLVTLPPVETKTLEEDEVEILKLRAKLFRYDGSMEPAEWKERGTGDVKLLMHQGNDTCRLLMRRDKTMKICANHYILPFMELKPNCGSDRAWVWSTPADFADEEVRQELLAIRFANAENAQKFKEKFEEAKSLMNKTLQQKGLKEPESEKGNGEKTEAESDTDKVAVKLEELNFKDKDSDVKPAASTTDSQRSSEVGDVKPTASTTDSQRSPEGGETPASPAKSTTASDKDCDKEAER